METESFALEMRDNISSPAKAIERSLANLKGGMKSLGDEMTALQAKQLKYREQGMNGLASQVGLEIAKRKMQQKALGDQVKDATVQQKKLADQQKATSKAAGLEADAMEALGGELLMVAKYSLAAAVALGALVFEGFKLASEAYTFRTHMSNVFEIYRGTAAEGAQTYEMVRRMSRTLPIPQEKAFESAQELLALNLSGQNRLHNTIMSIAQMQGVMGDQAGSKLKGIITGAQQSTMGGRFRGVFSVTPAELKEIGLSYDQLTNVLAKKLGQSNATTKQMLMYGRIDAATGIDAINEAVSKGAIGDKVKDALLAPDLLAKQFSDHIRDLFKDVDMKPLLREVRNIINMFDLGTTTGRSMKNGITSTFNAIGKAAKEGLIQIQIAVLDLEYYGLVAGTAFAPMIKEIKKLSDNKLVMDIMTEGVREFATGALMAAGAVALVAYQAAMWLNMADRFRTMGDDMETQGLNAVLGLARGVAMGANFFAKTLKDVADGGIKAVKDAFDSHSPSRKMMQVGRDLTAGLRIGAAEDGLTFNGASFEVKAKGGAGGRGGDDVTLQIMPGAVVIGGTAGMGQDELQDMVEVAFADLAERIKEELGRGSD